MVHICRTAHKSTEAKARSSSYRVSLLQSGVTDCSYAASWSTVLVGHHQGPRVQAQGCSQARVHGFHLRRGGLRWVGGGQQAHLSHPSCDLC
jgi:hypothetical protein